MTNYCSEEACCREHICVCFQSGVSGPGLIMTCGGVGGWMVDYQSIFVHESLAGLAPVCRIRSYPVVRGTKWSAKYAKVQKHTVS